MGEKLSDLKFGMTKLPKEIIFIQAVQFGNEI
jgi:hypothetical protein